MDNSRKIQHVINKSNLVAKFLSYRVLSKLTLATLLITVGSGLLLLAYYVPSLNNARESLYFLHSQVFLGWALHAFHFWGARITLILMFLHVVEAGFRRDLSWSAWISGLALLGVVLTSYLTGHLLSGTHQGYWDFLTTLEHLQKFPGGQRFLHIVLGWEEGVNDVVFSRSLGFHVSVFWVVGGGFAWIHLRRWVSRFSDGKEAIVWYGFSFILIILAILGTVGFLFPPVVEQPIDFFKPTGQVLLPFIPFASPLTGGLGHLHRLAVGTFIGFVFILPHLQGKGRRIFWVMWILGVLGMFFTGHGGG